MTTTALEKRVITCYQKLVQRKVLRKKLRVCIQHKLLSFARFRQDNAEKSDNLGFEKRGGKESQDGKNFFLELWKLIGDKIQKVISTNDVATQTTELSTILMTCLSNILNVSYAVSLYIIIDIFIDGYGIKNLML